MISEIPFTLSGKLKPGWSTVDQSSASSLVTYAGPDQIIQQRPGYLYSGWVARMEILAALSDPDGLLIASRCQHQAEDGLFWVRYRRHDLPGSPCQVRRPSAEQLVRWVLESAPVCLETEDLLRSAELSDQEVGKLIRAPWSKSITVRMISPLNVRSLLAQLGIRVNAPEPPAGRIVLSHGDLLPKNLIATTAGYRLIDWETLGLYPSYTTWSHLLSWLLLKIPESQWTSVLDQLLPLCLTQMELTEEEARTAIYWDMLREALFWKYLGIGPDIVEGAKAVLA